MPYDKDEYLMACTVEAKKSGMAFFNDEPYNAGNYIDIRQRQDKGIRVTVYDKCKLIIPFLYGVFGYRQDLILAQKYAEGLHKQVQKEKPVYPVQTNRFDSGWLFDDAVCSFLLGLIYFFQGNAVKGAYYVLHGWKSEQMNNLASYYLHTMLLIVMEAIGENAIEGEAKYSGCGFSADMAMGGVGTRFLNPKNALYVIPGMEGANGEELVAMKSGFGDVIYLDRRGSTISKSSRNPIDIYDTYVIDKNFTIKTIILYFNGYFGLYDSVKVANGFKIKTGSSLYNMFNFI